MHHSIEKEFKFLVEKNTFEETKRRIKTNGYKSDNKIQINYYYDTDDYRLLKSGSTVRVRQNGENLILQVKNHLQCKEEFSISNEYEKKIDFLHNKVFFECFSKYVQFLGSLITHRETFYFGTSGQICFDVNEYLGVVDYEIEIEFDEQDLKEAQEISKMIKRYLKPGNKYSRFVRQKELQQSEACFLTL